MSHILELSQARAEDACLFSPSARFSHRGSEPRKLRHNLAALSRGSHRKQKNASLCLSQPGAVTSPVLSFYTRHYFLLGVLSPIPVSGPCSRQPWSTLIGLLISIIEKLKSESSQKSWPLPSQEFYGLLMQNYNITHSIAK